MYCKHCGTEIDDDASFCFQCGKNNTSVENEKNDVPIYSKEKSIKKTKKANPLLVILLPLFIITVIVSSVIPTILTHKNNMINAQLNYLKSSNSTSNYFIDNIIINSSNEITVTFSDELDWEVLNGKEINNHIYIMESGAEFNIDTQDYSLAKGYTGYYPSDSYWAEACKEESDENYISSGYNLCVYSGYSEKLFKENTYYIEETVEDGYFNENRIYNFSIELLNPKDDTLYYYDSYFRYSNGTFAKITEDKLSIEDTYFIWKNGELHFAKYANYNEGTPYFYISDEVYLKEESE